MLAHERAHLKRLDHIIKPIGFVVLCVYWFNPLVWVAYILLCKDIELACDEKVIVGYEFGEKKAYAAALLDCSMHRRMVMACPLAFGEVGVKERVKSVLNYKKPAFWIIIIALVVCAVTGVCFLTNPIQAINVPKDPIIFVAKNSLDEEPALYWESEGLKYQFFMELTPDMVGECIGYDEYDGQKISNICKVKGMSEKEWICDTPQSEINKDTKGFVWKEVNVTDIPEGWEPLPFAETATSSNKEEPFVQGTYSSGDLDESREQNEGAKDVPTENANDWMDIKLPKDYAISGYQDNIGWQGGFMILPQSYEVYDEEGVYAPAEWTYSGLISRIPASSTEVTYSRGAGFPDMSGLPRDNHTDEEYIDTFKVPGSREQKQWHAIVRKVNHDLYTPSNIDMLEKEGKDMENMSQTSDYWEFWFVKEGEETYYILTLSAKEFTWEEALRIVGNLRINAK